MPVLTRHHPARSVNLPLGRERGTGPHMAPKSESRAVSNRVVMDEASLVSRLPSCTRTRLTWFRRLELLWSRRLAAGAHIVEYIQVHSGGALP